MLMIRPVLTFFFQRSLFAARANAQPQKTRSLAAFFWSFFYPRNSNVVLFSLEDYNELANRNFEQRAIEQTQLAILKEKSLRVIG